MEEAELGVSPQPSDSKSEAGFTPGRAGQSDHTCAFIAVDSFSWTGF